MCLILDTNNVIQILRGNLPLVYILDIFDYDEMKKNLNPETVNNFYDELDKLIISHNINVTIFDNFYPVGINFIL